MKHLMKCKEELKMCLLDVCFW